MKPSSLPNAKERAADERIAAFADQVIAGRPFQRSTQAAVPDARDADPNGLEEESLALLEETILCFNDIVKAARPDPAATARMQARLAAEIKQPAPSRWENWKNLLLRSTNAQFALAAAVLVVLLAAGLLLKPGTMELPGAALSGSFWAPLLLLAVALLILFIVRKDRS